MEAIKKQATRLREQVAKQQQAVLKHLGHFSNEGIIVDEAELQCYQHLQNLYNSTRAAKHFQKNIVRGAEGFVSISSKQMEILRKLADECCKYGAENQSENNYVARTVLQFGASHNLMENEKEILLGVLNDQVSKPLRALITGAPLEDARHLTHRYDKLRQEVEAQGAEVLRRRSKTRDSEISAESCMKLQAAEARLTELKSTMMALGREATAAMSSVENQQQEITAQRLFSMVDAERCYHQHVLTILDKLHAEVIHPFDAQAEGELSLSIDDFVVVRKVAPTGWSEGECKGKAGWFPSAYIEKHENSPASKIMEESITP
ncbi:PREDICTED: endophilin-A2 isoform X2 [Populus euphratica]|uniref:Endophilin-A2 isoform X2 n=1 Tax=Populus euphratica TaxID=75702 RepID=A0AAJ6TWF5_POPEU|nr:PREDICTED: endophilin-A2 isoform X2 [Populus euphratica]